MPIIETERLRLDEFSPDDADFILALVNEPGFHRFIGDRGVRSPADARHYLADRVIPSYSRNGFGLWRVALKEGLLPVGMCGLLKRDFLDDVDIGYALLETAQGHGYAEEAARATLEYARQPIGLSRIVAVIAPDNVRSLRLATRLGFAFQSALTWPDGGDDVHLYARPL